MSSSRDTWFRPGSRVYLPVINDLATDQRLQRLARLLLGQGLQVTCIGRRFRDSPPPPVLSYRTRRFRMMFTKGPLFYACFNLRLFLTLLFARKPVLFVANDLDTLPATFIVSRIRKVKLIYDSHELFTQVPELIHRRRVQTFWKLIEAWFIPRVKHAVTVSHSIAEIYRRLYGTRFRVVRNVPFRRQPAPDPALKAPFGASKMVIYQGSLNVGRGLELMIETMSFLEDTVFLIVGSGDIESNLRRLTGERNLEGRVIFKGRMSREELFPLTCTADLGVSLEEDLGLNYRYALPNKLFDYIQARVPVLCSNLPEMSRIVETYGVGMATGMKEPDKLARLIRYMIDERSQGAWMEALEKAAEELCWENESQIYLELLQDAGVL